MKESQDESNAGLRSRSIAALGWSAIDVAGRQGIQFAVTLVLVRLLSPAEFGLIGMLTLFIALASSIVDSGFGSALIQRKDITEEDKSSVFYFNAAVGAVMALALFFAASWIAGFYRQPILLPMTRWMSLNLFIDSFGVVQVALLTRTLNFRTQCKVSILAIVVSGATAVLMARLGYGVWSLVAQTLVYTAVSTALLWVVCPWKPTLLFRVQSLRSLYGFGSRMLVSGLLNTFFDRIQLTVIGKAFSARELGYYTRAFSTQQFPVALISFVVSRVTFPVFSQASHDIDLLRRGVKKALVSLMVLTFPMMIGLAVVAKPFVLVLFGPKWLPCVQYLRILSIAGALWPVHIVNLNVTMAMGRSDLFLRLEILKKILIGLGIVCTFRISVLAMVWAMLIVGVICVIINTHYTKPLIGYGLFSQLYDLAPYAAVSVLMAAVAWAVSTLLSGQPAVQLILSVLASISFYCGACYVLRLDAYRSVIASLAAELSRRRGVSAVTF